MGTQLPFDRLIEAVDGWAVEAGRTDIVAQVGRTAYSPRAIKTHEFLASEEFTRLQREAELLVAHCGIGSMVAALEFGQPVLMMPRRHALGEHRNDHQWATAQQLRGLPGVYVANDEQELVHHLGNIAALIASHPISATAPDEFVNGLRAILQRLTQ